MKLSAMPCKSVLHCRHGMSARDLRNCCCFQSNAAETPEFACMHAIACALKISHSISQYLQAQAQQLAAERSTLAEEQKQLATDLCHLEAQVQSHQLVTEARAKRDANHAATVQQLQVRVLSTCIRAQRMQSERVIGTCTACVLPLWLVKAQADIARAREQLRQDAQAFLSDTAEFQAKYDLEALEERKVAIEADLVSCTAEREAADSEHSCIHAAQQVQESVRSCWC